MALGFTGFWAACVCKFRMRSSPTSEPLKVQVDGTAELREETTVGNKAGGVAFTMV